MKLDKDDAKLFYKLNWGLLFYINQKYSVIKGLTSPNFVDQDSNKIVNLQKKAYKSDIIDSFISKNPFSFTDKELEIINRWKDYIEGKFFIISHTKDYTIFLHSEKEAKAYGVLGLFSEIKNILPPYVPLMCWTILLPFKGKIVHCGVITSQSIYFGSGIKKSIEEDYQKAKSKFGIITSLEFEVTEKKDADEELLKFYLRSENRRWEYQEEINKLLKKNPSLMKTYYQEIGKSNSRKVRKRFSQLCVKSGGWFAIFEDVIIASGQNEKEVRKQVETLVPEEKKEYVHIFKYGK